MRVRIRVEPRALACRRPWRDSTCSIAPRKLMKLFATFALAGSLLCSSAVDAQQAPTSADTRRNVAILVYPGVELLDFAGPGEVFATTHYPGQHAFEVYTVAETKDPVKSLEF